MNKIIQLLIILYTSSGLCQSANEYFSLSWENFVGITSFRTTIKVHNGIVYVPSNGHETHLPGDEYDGVHALNAFNGKKETHYFPNHGAVEDCNGVAIGKDKLYFGNDDGMFFCYQLDGTKLWEYKLGNEGSSGTENDIEGAPVLSDLNQDSVLDVVFNVESRGIFALDGSNGTLLWFFNFPDDEGSYMNAPAAYDLNGDGTKDFIMGGKRSKDPTITWDYLNAVYAINGKTGSPLWQYSTQSGIHASPIIIKCKNQTKILIAEAYSDVTILQLDGKFEKYINLNLPQGSISGLFASPVISDKKILVIGTSWWGERDGIWLCPLIDGNFKIEGDGLNTFDSDKRKYYQTGKVSSSAVVADVTKKSKGKEIIVCTEAGKMMIFSEKGDLIESLDLPAGVEATPFIGDIDGDKKSEILVACLNGKIYCYKTGVKSKKKIHVGQFRNDPLNSGVLKF